MDDDELSDQERRTLDALAPFAPPAGFADRVLDAREQPRRSRRPLVIGGIAAACAAAALAVVLHRPSHGPSHRAAHGTVAATERTTTELGDRGIAVAEPASRMSWRVADNGDAEIDQAAGNVFYRVERGGSFVVHTPGGDARVTGTCFRIEIEPMNPTQKMILSGAVGAALASTVLVTVYEGHVLAEGKTTHLELAAGAHATLGGQTPDQLVADDGHATREVLLARANAQRDEVVRLRARLAELERAAGKTVTDATADAGRAWYDPSPDSLAQWAKECRVRVDEPQVEHFQPLKTVERGLEPGELDGYNGAMGEVAKQWHDLVRALYLEATGDTAGADTLSVEAMHREIEEKSPKDEYAPILQRIANERAGLAAPPADLSHTSPLERLLRGYFQLGNQSEAAVAQRLGAARAHEIRGEGWGSRHEHASCP